MSIESVNAVGAEAISNSVANSAEEIKDQFLTMLMAQMQHQDPLNPMETAEFTSQLAQLSSVEQLQSVNKNLTYLQLYMASINNSQSLQFVGKEVVASGNTVSVDGEHDPSMHFRLNGPAERVVVNVYDSNNHLVHTDHQGSLPAGNHSITWSGKNNNGEDVPPGTYTFNVMAVDEAGETVRSATMMSGIVDGLTFREGTTYVVVDGQTLPIGDIAEIRAPEEAAADGGDAEADTEGGVGETVSRALTTLGALGLRAAPLLF